MVRCVCTSLVRIAVKIAEKLQWEEIGSENREKPRVDASEFSSTHSHKHLRIVGKLLGKCSKV